MYNNSLDKLEIYIKLEYVMSERRELVSGKQIFRLVRSREEQKLFTQNVNSLI